MNSSSNHHHHTDPVLRNAKVPPPVFHLSDEAAFGYPRDFLENKFVYLVISPRARGLSIGLNLNPVVKCNLHCAYCEVDRSCANHDTGFDVNRMIKELGETLELAQGGWLRQWKRYAKLPPELSQVRHVALSGDGEPTLSEHFLEATQAVVHLRQTGRSFKLVLVTNSTALDRPQVQTALKLFAPEDEIWAKLDAGTQSYFTRINGSALSLDQISDNILLIARQRPVVIQSLFPALDGEEPDDSEVQAYAHRLKDLTAGGGHISLVQIYSATRPAARKGCGHLPLHALSRIAKTVRRVSGLRAEVF